MAYVERIAAWQTLLAAQRAQKIAAAAASASFTSIMSGVAVNTISAQNITDLTTAQTNWNAATAAYDAAIVAANGPLTKVDSGV